MHFFGSAPMGVRELKECRDADIIVMEDLWNEYRSKLDWQYHKAESGNESLSKGSIELWRDWRPWFPDVSALIADAEIVDGLPFVRLERVLEWKKAYGREKDLKDVAAIENYLASDIRN